MDDFLLMVEALLNGKPWNVFVQIPHNKHSREIAESLAYGGLWPLFQGKCDSIGVEEVQGMDKRRFFGLVTVKGITVKDNQGQEQKINHVEIAVQLPRFVQVDSAQVLYQMVAQGLGYYLGATIKRVHVKSAGETIPEALENERLILA